VKRWPHEGTSKATVGHVSCLLFLSSSSKASDCLILMGTRPRTRLIPCPVVFSRLWVWKCGSVVFVVVLGVERL